jgi:ubiquitin-like protein Pup
MVVTQGWPTRKRRRIQTEEPPPSQRVTVETMDEILDGIDEILEENECAVLRSYRQKGGE